MDVARQILRQPLARFGGDANESAIRSSLRRWERARARDPLHDAHVNALWSVWPKGVPKRMLRCPACHQVKRPWEWKREKSGHKAKHCGCRSGLVVVFPCERCGATVRRAIAGVKKRWCASCGPVMARSARLARKQRMREARWASGATRRRPTLHDAHVKAWHRSMRVLHDAHVRLWRSSDARVAKWRHAHDVNYMLNQRLRVQIRKALKGMKAGRTWESIVGYSLHDLHAHLKRQLRRGESMEDFFNGRLHIDHIVPKSAFDMSNPEEVKACWALTNLMPLRARQNMRKSSKRIHLV